MADEAKTKTGATTDDGKRRVASPRVDTSEKVTAPAATTTREPETKAPSAPAPKPPPEASPRNYVAVNVASITAAFHGGAKSRSVRAIQTALTARGFQPGNSEGLADYGTRAAYAKFQESVSERATGIPTADSLDILGFDVVG